MGELHKEREREGAGGRAGEGRRVFWGWARLKSRAKDSVGLPTFVAGPDR